MATIVKTVNPGGGADYTSVAAALAANKQDLTSVACDLTDPFGFNVALRINVSGTTADTGGQWDLSDAAWVTDANHRIEIRNATPGGAKWDTSKPRASMSDGFTCSIRFGGTVRHVSLTNLQVENTATLDNAPKVFRGGAAAWDLNISGGFYRCTSTSGAASGATVFFADSSTHTLRVAKPVFAAAGSGCIPANWGGGTSSTVIVYSATLVSRAGTGDVMEFGKSAGCTHRYKNLVLQGGGACYVVGDQPATETATILSQDTSSPTTGLRSKTVAFVDATNWDYHLSASDTAAKGAGTNLSSDAYLPVSVDGDGDAYATPPSVGADEPATTVVISDEAWPRRSPRPTLRVRRARLAGADPDSLAWLAFDDTGNTQRRRRDPGFLIQHAWSFDGDETPQLPAIADDYWFRRGRLRAVTRRPLFAEADVIPSPIHVDEDYQYRTRRVRQIKRPALFMADDVFPTWLAVEADYWHRARRLPPANRPALFTAEDLFPTPIALDDGQEAWFAVRRARDRFIRRPLSTGAPELLAFPSASAGPHPLTINFGDFTLTLDLEV